MTGTRFTVCWSFDFDAMSVWIGSAKSNNPSMISRGEFGAVAVPRILALLKKYNVQSTFFIPGHTALAFPDLVKHILDHGHEVGHHGWIHENPADFDLAGERAIIERGLDALEKTGGPRPIGYRSPAWDLSPHTLDLLKEYGFLYDSSCMANDYSPYYLRSGDKWSVDKPYEFGKPTDMVELPVSWSLDDFPTFEFVMGVMGALNSPCIVEDSWRGDFEWGYENVPGGVMTITLHPQVIGRGARMLMLERLIQTMQEREGVTFSSMANVAQKWKAANPSS
ncbi:MAG: polysaccharide deacetylase [Proteobacteria bacterium]|nr:MAG: polysaccharide deacetylase [Pseudomonadota bacterium]